ncbi:ash family protein [Aeromonas hydrophila]|uniref:ash family protein n=3 Tax=Aeromonas hydrophila TaxID=644 RepID=UPI000ABA3FAE|nr:ash family protein [Aeromonas hydrophila]
MTIQPFCVLVHLYPTPSCSLIPRYAMKNQYGLTAQGEALLKPQGMGLFFNVQQGSIRPAAAKSVAEIGVSGINMEPTHALACFVVGTRPSSLGAPLGCFSCVMAVRARASQGALGSVVTSYANLVRAATILRLASSGGRENLTTTEAAIMATVPTQALSSRLRSRIAHPCHSAALWRLCIPTPCCMTTYRVIPPDRGLIV